MFALKHFLMYNMYYKSEGRTRVIKKYSTDGIELTLKDRTVSTLATFTNFHEEVNDNPCLLSDDE